MYILPLLFSNLHLGTDGPFDSMGPTFGRTNLVQPEELISRILDRHPINFDNGVLDFYHRPRLNLVNHILSSTSIDDNVFKITINVQQYKPEEITVKVVDRSVVVKGKHEDKQDENNVISRQFVRQYLLPNGADVDQITSTLSSDGCLTIIVPLKPVDEKEIKIEQIGQPAISSNNQNSDQDKILTTDSSNSQAGTSEATIEKKAENNEVIREEVTATQAQEAGPKPEK